MVAQMEALDAEVLATLKTTSCVRPSWRKGTRLALEELTPARQSAGRRSLDTELPTVRQECEGLADTIATGGCSTSS